MMDIETKIKDLKKQLLDDLSKEAKVGNTKKIIRISKEIEELEDIDNSRINLEQRLTISIQNKDNLNESTLFITQTGLDSIPSLGSPKALGKIRRNEFISVLKKAGINAIHQKGVIYEINGHRIGIATACESNYKKWFLGLPNVNFTTVVLIIETSNKVIKYFILSKDLYSLIKGKLSKSSEGNLPKFNIKQEGSHYYLIVPNSEDIIIDHLINNFENLNNL